MTAKEKWSGAITLPDLRMPSLKVGGNMIQHIGQLSHVVNAKIFGDPIRGVAILKTNLQPPFDEILLRQTRSKTPDDPKKLCLISSRKFKYEDFGVTTKLSWYNIEAFKSLYSKPDVVTESWTGIFSFKKENSERDELGLRAPQLGALHAVSSYFAIDGKYEPATIVLPTGTGKTETMLASLIYNQHKKLLVLVPSDALRTQLLSKFLTLGFLPIAGIVPKNIICPRVACIKIGIKSIADAKAILEHSNVIIATPSILENSNPDAFKTLCEGCSDLFIDEAHHGTAKTWENVRQEFLLKRVTQFTATPFRNDGQHIGGKIIFNYKLGEAQRANFYKPIRLITIEEYGDEAKKDRIIAQKAINVLKDDIKTHNNHLMMARVDTKLRADLLYDLYMELAPEFNPVVVYSSSGKKTENQKSLNALHRYESRIVICVNMLGEGFDLPQLKIAAIHDGHKSLAITLQFIGRFTRKATDVGDAAVVVNIADPQTEKNVQKLYSEGANWDEVIKRLSEDRIDTEIKLQDIIEDLKNKGNLHDQLSLWNVKPGLVTQVYKTDCEEWTPEKYPDEIQSNLEHLHSIADKKNLLVVLGVQEVPLRWSSQKEMKDLAYKLLMIYWNKDIQVLFVHTNDYDAFRLNKLTEIITNSKTKLLNGPSIFNVLNNVELPLVKNLGASRIGAISFTSYFGPNVTDGLAAIEKNDAELNNIACLGYEDGERVLWGAAQKKGKIWSVKNGSIYEWLEWCDKTWKKVSSEELDQSNIVRDFLRPVKLVVPHPAPAIAIQWGEHIQAKLSTGVFIVFGEKDTPLFSVDIAVKNVGVISPIEVCISSEENETIYDFVIDEQEPAGYRYNRKSGDPVYFKYGKNNKKSLEDHIITDPFIIRYSDGTYSYNNYLIPLNLNAGKLAEESIEEWDWTGVSLNEESMGKNIKQHSIQYRVYDEIKDEYSFIFNDDAKGEAADLIALSELSDGSIKLCLVHCKNAKDGEVSQSIDNMYTVCGQAQKSIRVKHNGLSKLFIDCQRRQKKWEAEGFTRLLKGDFKTLAYFRDKAKKSKLVFEVIIVQPGLSKGTVTDDVLRLLGTTELYLKKTTEANFRIIASK